MPACWTSLPAEGETLTGLLTHITEGILSHMCETTCSLQSGAVKHALNPDPYRGRFGNDGPAYAEDVRDIIQTATSGQVAGFLSETIQGVGGATPLADGYLAETYKVSIAS